MLFAASHSIRRKLALLVLVTTTAALLMAGSAMMFYDLRDYREALASDLAAQGGILGRASTPALVTDDAHWARENLSMLRTRPDVLAAAIYNARGKVLASYRREGDLPIEFPALPEADGSRVEGSEFVLFRRVVDRGEILGTVYLRAEYELMERLRDYAGILAASFGLSLLVALALSSWLQGALTRPILAVTQAARQVTERKDFSLRAPRLTDDEIGVLVDAFNDMVAELGRRAEALEQARLALEREIGERTRMDEELRALNAKLEARVGERTAQLEAANKDLEGFSYSVSHDLRAPLRGVVGFADALMEDHGADLSEEARRKIGIIQDEARRMGMLIDDLLSFSRLGRKALQVVPLDMGKLARSTYEGLRSQYNGCDFEFHVGTLPEAAGDRALLGQVWINLISNAMKFSSKREKPKVVVSAITDAREHIYFVRDNGAGFNPKYMSKLFGVFQRLHASSEFPGTGVGLALVQRIVDRHGGRVWAEGKPGEGATFYFSLLKEQPDVAH